MKWLVRSMTILITAVLTMLVGMIVIHWPADATLSMPEIFSATSRQLFGRAQTGWRGVSGKITPLPVSTTELQLYDFVPESGSDAYREALREYRAGEYEKAAKTLLTQAEKGDAAAQNLLGILYRNGLGVQNDPQEALFLFTRAARVGLPDARANLASMLISGKGVTHDEKEARIQLRLAAEQNHRGAIALLANLDATLGRKRVERTVEDKSRALQAAYDRQMTGTGK